MPRLLHDEIDENNPDEADKDGYEPLDFGVRVVRRYEPELDVQLNEALDQIEQAELEEAELDDDIDDEIAEEWLNG